MNEIIKNIEDAQLKAEVAEFNVGDTVKVYGKIREGNHERIQVFKETGNRSKRDLYRKKDF
jgi:large subunit ribosomal protein L19